MPAAAASDPAAGGVAAAASVDVPRTPWVLDATQLRVVVIRLASRVDVPGDALATLREQFPRAVEFAAVDGATVDLADASIVSRFARHNIETGVRRRHSEIYSRGAVGAYLSHVRVLQDFADAPDAGANDVLLVLEDDVRVRGGWATALVATAAEMPPPPT